MLKMGSRMEERLKEIVVKVLLIDKARINDEMSREDMEEWDSMAHLMLVSEVESAFEVMMSDDDIMEIQTFGDIKKVLRKLGVPI